MSGCSGRAASNDVEGKSNKLRMCQAKGVAENVPVPGTKPGWPAQGDGIAGWTTFWVEKPKEMISETFPIRTEHFDRPISLQQGCFTFHVPESSTIPESDPVQSFIIPSESKKAIREQLAAINIHHFSVYGDLRSLAKFLSETYGF